MSNRAPVHVVELGLHRCVTHDRPPEAINGHGLID